MKFTTNIPTDTLIELIISYQSKVDEELPESINSARELSTLNNFVAEQRLISRQAFNIYNSNSYNHNSFIELNNEHERDVITYILNRLNEHEGFSIQNSAGVLNRAVGSISRLFNCNSHQINPDNRCDETPPTEGPSLTGLGIENLFGADNPNPGSF